MDLELLSSSSVRDENGKLLMMYRGDYRADALKNGFKIIEIDSEGSGGLYFTDNPKIASSYAQTKSYFEEDACEAWKFIEVTLDNRTMPLVKSSAWMGIERKKKLKSQVLLLSESGNSYRPTGEDSVIGESTFTDYLDRHGKNYAKTIIDLINQSGLSLDGEDFTSILKSLEVFDKVTYNDPYRQESIVTPVYLDIKNPLCTDSYPKDFFERMEALIGADDDTLLHLKENHGEMMETVVNLTPEFRNALIKMGYDGVMDVGGRITGGESHTVYIAFSPNQIEPAYSKESVEYRKNLEAENTFAMAM